MLNVTRQSSASSFASGESLFRPVSPSPTRGPAPFTVDLFPTTQEASTQTIAETGDRKRGAKFVFEFAFPSNLPTREDIHRSVERILDQGDYGDLMSDRTRLDVARRLKGDLEVIVEERRRSDKVNFPTRWTAQIGYKIVFAAEPQATPRPPLNTLPYSLSHLVVDVRPPAPAPGRHGTVFLPLPIGEIRHAANRAVIVDHIETRR